MVKVSLCNHQLTASAALVWSGDLPRPLQQMLFQTATISPRRPPNYDIRAAGMAGADIVRTAQARATSTATGTGLRTMSRTGE